MNKTEFAKKQYFNSDMKTFVVVGGNTYDIKDELKSIGYKFTKELGWHSSSSLVVPEGYDLLELTFDECFNDDLELKNEIRDRLKKETRGTKQSGTSTLIDGYEDSTFIGEEGERIRNIPVKFIGKTITDGMYGPGYRILFDYSGNILVWFTSSAVIDDFEAGETISLSFTVKSHKTYGGVNQTVITRGLLKKVS